jgi:hypothetical protein
MTWSELWLNDGENIGQSSLNLLLKAWSQSISITLECFRNTELQSWESISDRACEALGSIPSTRNKKKKFKIADYTFRIRIYSLTNSSGDCCVY